MFCSLTVLNSLKETGCEAATCSSAFQLFFVFLERSSHAAYEVPQAGRTDEHTHTHTHVGFTLQCV